MPFSSFPLSSSLLLFLTLLLLSLISIVYCDISMDSISRTLYTVLPSRNSFPSSASLPKVFSDSFPIPLSPVTCVSTAFIGLSALFYSLRSRPHLPDPFFCSPHPLSKVKYKQNISTPTDILIVGAGVAGAALAAALGKRGYRVICVEQNMSEQHRIVGELLQPLGVQCMKLLGIDDALEGFDAQDVMGYCIIMKGKRTKFHYPHVGNKEVRGKSFHNGKFVQSLRGVAMKQESVKFIKGTAKKLIYDTNVTDTQRVIGLLYTDDEGVEHSIHSPLTVVSDGCLSSFRSQLVTNRHVISSSFMGLILKDCELPQQLSGHVICADPSPILVYPIASRETRMLIDFPNGTKPTSKSECITYMREKVLPQLPVEIRPSFLNAIEEGEKSPTMFPSMPSQTLASSPNTNIKGVLLLGDIHNMRHPLTGGGMSVALSDIHLIVGWLSQLKDFNNLEKLDSLIQSHYDIRNSPVRVINMLADALYQVFLSKNDTLRENCFDYLNKGGMFLHGPITFLSGISHNQGFLIFHFFAVAAFSMRELFPIPTPKRISTFWGTMRTAVSIMMPLVVQENPNFLAKAISSTARTIFWV